MALRNYLYAKHDNSPLLSNRISGLPIQNSNEVFQTTKQFENMTINKHHPKKQGKACRNCADCPKRGCDDGDNLEAKTGVKIDDDSLVNNSKEINFNEIEF